MLLFINKYLLLLILYLVNQLFLLWAYPLLMALIKDRLEKSAVEKANITVSPEEIDAKIEQIAQARRLTLEQMIEILAKRGLSWDNYRKQLEIEIKKEKFFTQNIASNI